MLSQLIWWSSIALEALLLLRGLQTRLAFRYPFFFSYVAFVFFFEDLLSLVIRDSPIYAYAFWGTEFVGILLGCGVVFEIYRIGLGRFPGTATMARNALGLIFVLAATKGLVAAASNSGWWLQTNTLELARSIRTVQAFAIVGFALVLLMYSIPFGKNLRGILFGYGLYVSVLAVTLTLVPDVGHGFWFYALSASYLIALVTWLVHLWSYQENPAAGPTSVSGGGGYTLDAAATRRRLESARGELVRTVRP
jgi:hypothetical protein